MDPMMHMHLKTPVEVIRELAAEGKTYDEIGAELGFSYSKVFAIARDNDIAVTRKSKVSKAMDEIEKLASEGVSQTKIAESLGLSFASVHNAMKRNGIKVMKEDKRKGPSARSVRLAEIKRLHGEGKVASDIAGELGISRKLVIRTYKVLGINIVDEKNSQKADRVERIRALAEEGLVSGEIADELGIHPDTLRIIARKFSISLPRLKPVEHGTFLSYQRGCTCEKCRAANTEAGRRQKESRKSREVPKELHGTFNGYQNWGCHCAPCKEAGAVKNRLNVTLDVSSERKSSRWTPEEDLVVNDYSLTARELALKLNRTVSAVNTRRNNLSKS